MQDQNRYFDIEDMFCNLFYLAGKYGVRKENFTIQLSKSNFAIEVEKGDYNSAYNESVIDVFNGMLDSYLSSEDIDDEWNDYYWVGKAYFYIQDVTHKSFCYIFMKLPFEVLHKMFDLYHEMDMSHTLEVFYECEKQTTILKELCKRRKMSINKLSEETNIPVSTLTKYRKSDEALYKANFRNIYILSRFFDMPETLFLDSIPQEK